MHSNTIAFFVVVVALNYFVCFAQEQGMLLKYVKFIKYHFRRRTFGDFSGKSSRLKPTKVEKSAG